MFRSVAQLVLVLKTKVHLGLIPEAISVLNDLNSKLSTQNFSPTAPEFDANLLISMLSECFLLSHSLDDEFSGPFRIFLDRWIFLAASYSLSRFVSLVDALTETPEQQQANSALVYYISVLFERLGSEEAERFLALSVKLIRDCPISYLGDVRPGFLVKLRDALTVEEVRELVEEMTDVSSVGIPVILCQKDPGALIPDFVEQRSLRYVADFLEALPVDCAFDSMGLIARLADATVLDDEDELFACLRVFPPLIRRIVRGRDEIEVKCLNSGGVWAGVFSKIPESSENVKIRLINCLFLAADAGLVDVASILSFLDNEIEKCVVLQSSGLQLLLHALDSAPLRTRLFPFLRRLAIERLRGVFPELIEGISNHYDQLFAIDERETAEAVHLLFAPVSTDPLVREKLLLLLSEHPLCEAIDLYSFCVETLHNRPTEASVRYICSLNLRFPAVELDWFTPATSHLNFAVLNSELTLFHVLELLRIHAFLPEHLSVPLTLLSQSADAMGPLAFFDLFATLLLALECIDIPTAQFGPEVIDIVAHAHPWADSDRLRALSQSSLTPFADSAFGRLLTSFLNFLVAFKKSVTAAIVVVVTMIRICGLLGPLIGDRILAILLAFFADLRHPTVPVSLVQRKIVSGSVRACLRADFPVAVLPRLVRAAAEIFGPRIAYRQMQEKVNHLIETDFEIARLFAKELPLDIPPLRTFLAFADRDDRQEWVERCQREIPQSEWIDPPRREREPTVSATAAEPQEEEEQRTFTLCPPEIEEGPVVHEGQPGSVSAIVSFLWFSRKQLPLDLAVFEQFMILNASNSKLIVGFFAYVKDFELTINVDRFADALIVDRGDPLSILAVALLISFVKGPFGETSEALLGLIRRLMFAFGFCDISPSAIVRASATLRGVDRVAIESILQIDPSTFGYFTPATVYDWALAQISGRMMLDDYYPIVSALSRTVFPNPEALTRKLLLPHRRSVNFSCVTMFTTLPSHAVAVTPPPSFAAIVDALDAELVVSHEMAQCLLAMEFDPKTTHRLLLLIDQKLPKSPSSAFSVQTPSTDLAIGPARSDPPSHFRAFLRTILTVNSISRRQPHVTVHRGLSYAGSARPGDQPSGCLADDLTFGIIDLKTVMGAQAVMFADGALNQIGVFKALMGVDAKALLRVHAWKTVEEAQRQWAGQLVARALQNDAPCSFALEVETCLVETMGCTVAADVILGIGWTSLRNWLNGLVLLRALERSLGDENQELRDRIKDFRECERAKAGVRNGFPTEIDITRFLCQ